MDEPGKTRVEITKVAIEKEAIDKEVAGPDAKAADRAERNDPTRRESAPGRRNKPVEQTSEDASGKQKLLRVFDRFASGVTRWTGSPFVFSFAVLLVVVWAVTGPMFHYSETWQLVINTGTTIVTFLMVFLIQQSQNKDSQAVHLKLDELLKAMENARNSMIDIENLTEGELEKLAQQFKNAAPSE